MYKVLIFGTGGVYSVLKKNLNYDKVKIQVLVDSNVKKQGEILDGFKIISPSEINNYEYDYIIIASGQYDSIVEQLNKVGVKKDKILGSTLNNSKVVKELIKEFNDRLNFITNINTLNELLLKDKTIESYYSCNMPLLSRKRLIKFDDYHEVDYIRLSALELVAHEINSKKLKGCVAELGVYKGDFAQKINQLFPNRKFYLFDTYEGFNLNDVELDMVREYSSNITNQFSDTSINLVLNKMKYPNNCVIKKGYFPKTAFGLNEQYAFVSIDADLYTPIYKGLEYFYKRLIQGGYIFIHDYNNFIFKGAKSAVRDFCKKNEIGYFPLSDVCGTAVILK